MHTRYEIEVLPWAIDDVREAYIYLLERDERLAEVAPEPSWHTIAAASAIVGVAV